MIKILPFENHQEKYDEYGENWQTYNATFAVYILPFSSWQTCNSMKTNEKYRLRIYHSNINSPYLIYLQNTRWHLQTTIGFSLVKYLIPKAHPHSTRLFYLKANDTAQILQCTCLEKIYPFFSPSRKFHSVAKWPS